MDKKKHISDLVGDDYKSWKRNDRIIFDAGTGTGKTTFCLEILAKYARENNRHITYLVNRSELKKSIISKINELGISDTVEVLTYQAVQDHITKGEQNPRNYYLICDECHYFTADAFNGETDRSYMYVKKEWPHAVVIYMSATSSFFFRWLISQGHVKEKNYYRIEQDYSYVDHLYVYKSRNLMTRIVDRILELDKDSKVVVFCNATDKLVEMHAIYHKNANYMCSTESQNSKARDINEPNAIKNNTFEKRVLFCTSALYNGVDLKDKRIRYIVSELFDVDSMIQAIGRKRPIDKYDTCDLFIFEQTNRTVNFYRMQNDKKLDVAKEYKENPSDFIKKHMRDRKFLQKHPYFYQGFDGIDQYNIMLNNIMFTEYVEKRKIYKQMVNEGYLCVVINRIGGKLLPKSSPIDEWFGDYLVHPIISVFKRFENKPLFKDEREEIKQSLEELKLKPRSTGINTFNKIIDKYCPEYDYRFTNKDENGRYLVENHRKMPNGEVNSKRSNKYWLLTKCKSE